MNRQVYNMDDLIVSPFRVINTLPEGKRKEKGENENEKRNGKGKTRKANDET